MAGKKRTAEKQGAAPMYRKLRHNKRAETRITVTPLVRNSNLPRRPVGSAKEKPKEQIESVGDEDDWWALPLPTSPAPSPPRPLDICTPSKCTVHVDPNATQSYTYRPLYDENNKTLKDALGRPVAGRHRIPGTEVTRDRSYMHLTHEAIVDHRIAYWPRPPFDYDNPDVLDRFIDEYHKKNDENMAEDTPPINDPPIAVHTTAKKTMARLPRRLFTDDSEVVEERDGEDDDVSTLEKEKEATLDRTDMNHTRRDMRSASSSMKQRSSKIPIEKGRKSSGLISIGSIKSNGLKMSLPVEEMEEDDKKEEEEEGMEEGDKDEEEEEVVDRSTDHTEDHLMAGDNSVIVDIEKKGTEDEIQVIVHATRPHSRGDMGETSSSSRKRRASKQLSMKDTKSSSRRLFDVSFKSNGVRRLDESMEDVEVIDMSNEERDDEENETMEEVDDECGDEEEDQVEGRNKMRVDRSTEGDDEEEVEELDDEEEDNEDDEMEESGLDNYDKTLPLSSVVHSITNNSLRRLLAECNQTDITKMEDFMSGISWGVKVGEGSFAEVFQVKREWSEKSAEKRVFKLMRIEEEDANKFLGEVIISKEVTRLSRSSTYSTTAFCKMYSAKVLQGQFPSILADAWEDFFNTHDENEAMNVENPAEWGETQMYLCLECEFGGLNLKKFMFSSVLEVVSVFCQTALALAVAEAEFELEHRDLHEENVLVKATDEDSTLFVYSGSRDVLPKAISVPTHGVKMTIIDFTLSRMTKGSETIHHEIGDDVCEQNEKAEQYEVYRKMKKMTKGKWTSYKPKSNVLWLRMQLNWIIKENLNPKSKMNKSRVKASKEAKKANKGKEAKRKSTMTSSIDHSEERKEIGGDAWLKKLKEGKGLIGELKIFVKKIATFESATDLVDSPGFAKLHALLA